MHLPYYHPDAA